MPYADDLQQYFRTFDSRQARELEVFFRMVLDGLNLNMNTLTGDLIGDVTGDVTGDQTGERTDVKTTYAVDTNLSDGDFPTQFVELDGGTANVQITNWTPTVGKTYVIWCSDSTNTTTVTMSSGGTWEGTNDLATFDAANDALIVYAISTTRVLIIENLGSVGFS
ncbi:MAG: hypothetical protein GWN00_21615 [Aliifodinibius sp.]|nr:hypothetical protein [Fodinibius sp.]NIV13548.1 hypothetical protein [Fodinibius sp.]NIY27305.1 hypothetical protein [Fodinibius sp.]